MRVDEVDCQVLCDVGFFDRDIWDIVFVTGFFNMMNCVAFVMGMELNLEYYVQAR